MDTSRDFISGLIIWDMSGVGSGCLGSISDSVSGVLIESVEGECTEEVEFHPYSLLLAK